MNTRTEQPGNRSEPLSLLDEIGGEAALDALVGALYFNVLQDRRIAHFFAGTDVDAIRRHQRLFLEYALGGENNYRGRALGDAHRQLVDEQGLNESHFDAVIELLASTLHDLGYARETANRVTDRVSSLRAEVLG